MDAQCGEPRPGRPLSVDDYLKVIRIDSVSVSDDGTMAAFVAGTTGADAGREPRKTTYVIATDRPGAAIRSIPVTDVRALKWVPGSHRLAWIGGPHPAQVCSIEVPGEIVTRVTNNREPVVDFQFAPNGLSLAYATDDYPPDPGDSRGILLDTDTIDVTALLKAASTGRVAASENHTSLWIQTGDGTQALPLAVPGEVKNFRWSPDSRNLSVVYVPVDSPPSLYRDIRTAIGLLDVRSHAFRALGVPRLPLDEVAVVSFSGGEWVPHSTQFLVRRVLESTSMAAGADPLSSWHFPQWSIVDVDTALDSRTQWHSIEVRGDHWFPVTVGEILLENERYARTGLFRVAGENVFPIARMSALGGSSTHFAFSHDYRVRVFVNESFDRPPELYVQKDSNAPRRLTGLNDFLADVHLPHAGEIQWTSRDGMTAQGWLLEPDRARFPRPWPLVTFLHGGPDVTYPEAFAPYFDAWPYPLEMLPQAGIAVFVPNYRGNPTFGRAYESPSEVDSEPREDVITGIDHLVASGIADAGNLGIAGHSWGVWLGLMTIAETNRFKATAFAEGWPNWLVSYELTNSQVDREYWDHYAGGPPRLRLDRYVELSPGYRLVQPIGPALLEAGTDSTAAMQMIGVGKALRLAGSPVQFVLYPHTGHNPQDVQVRRESASRTFDWFRHWLGGRD